MNFNDTYNSHRAAGLGAWDALMKTVKAMPRRQRPYVARYEQTGTARYWTVYRKSDGMTFGVGATLEAAIECARQHPYAY